MAPPLFCPWVHLAADQPRLRPWQAGPRRITHWILVLSLDGEEQIEVDGQTCGIPAGSSYLLPPGSLSRLGSRQGNRPVWLHFDLAYHPQREHHPQAHGYAPELGPRRAWMQPPAREVLGLDLPVPVPEAVAPLFRSGVPAAVTAWQRGGDLARLEAANRVGALVLALAAHLRGRERREPDEMLARAEAAALAGLAAGSGPAEMAAAAGLSRTRFFALWRARRKGTPAAFLRAERMRIACQLLAAPGMTVTQVGSQVGYPDPTVFGRVFRAATGLTPGAWRARRG